MKLSKFIEVLQRLQIPGKDMEVRLSDEFGLSRVSVFRDANKGIVVVRPDNRVDIMNARRRELRRIRRQTEQDKFYATNKVQRSFKVETRRFPKFGGV